MTGRILPSGYIHIRLDLNRFAQFPADRDGSPFFGWWTESEKREAEQIVADLRERER